MRAVLLTLLLSLAGSCAWAQQTGPAVEVRVRNAGEATGATTYPSVVNPRAPRPDALVTGDHVTITDFRDLVVSVDGAPPASTTIRLERADGTKVGDSDAIGLFMDKPLKAEITSGADNFHISDDKCTGALLGAPGQESSTCEVYVEPRAKWWGPIAGTLTLSTGSYHTDIALSGYAHHFDPLALSLVVVTGDPSAFDVNGEFSKGNLFGGTVARSSNSTTFRVTNASTEYATPKLVTSLSSGVNFEFLTDGCSGVSVPAGGTCDITVGAKATWWGAWGGVLTVKSAPSPEGDPDIVLTADLAGRSHHFDPPRLSISVRAGDPDHMDVVGPTLPSYSANAVLRVVNLSTEYPTSALSSRIAATTGPGAIEIIADACAGFALPISGMCDVTLRAKASWWGVLASTYGTSGGGEAGAIAAARAVSGRAYHFDLPRPVLTLVSGDPAHMDVVGWAKGVTAHSGVVTYRVTNASTEETTDALSIGLSNNGNFEITLNGCGGRQLSPGSYCDVGVRSKAIQNGAFSGYLAVNNHTFPSVSLAGTGTQFYTYGWVASGWSGCTANPYWSGWGGCSNTCGGGTQYRSCQGMSGTEYQTVWCRRDDGSIMGDVSNYYPGCEGANRPVTSEACSRTCSGADAQGCYDVSTCSYSWVGWSGWSGCSNTCGGGTMTGSQNCLRSDGQYVDASHCDPTWPGTWGVSSSGASYTWATGCYDVSTCSYSWADWSGWGGCSASCGGGTQYQTANCRRSDGQNVDQGHCGGSWGGGPTYTWGQSCNTQSCCTPNNYVYSYGSWSDVCGQVSRTRYWTNGCGAYWTDIETSDLGICEQTFDVDVNNGGCGLDYVDYDENGVEVPIYKGCSCVTPDNIWVPYQPSADWLCRTRGYSRAASFQTRAGDYWRQQCNPDGNSCFYNQNAGNIVCTSITCTHRR